REALLGRNAEAFSKQVLDAWSSVQLERAIDIFMKLYRDIRYSLNVRYEMELAISRLTWLKEYVSPAEVKKALDGIKPLLAKSAASQPATAGAVMAQGGTGGGIGWTPPPFRDGGAEPPLKKTGGEENAAVTQGTIPQAEEAPAKPAVPAAAASPLDPEALFKSMLQNFAATDGLLSAALSDSVGHRIQEDKLEVTVSSPFAMMQLKARAADVTAYLSNASGRTFSFDVIMEENKEEQKAEIKLPPQVELLRDTFKGSVIGM
ncbi:MAG: hypothetical protein IJU95_08565, partial [Treponema sp.]|nr:hypothetical protein [Treponema sp.]